MGGGGGGGALCRNYIRKKWPYRVGVGSFMQELSSGKHVRVMYTPLNPNSKTGVYRGIPIFLIFASKHRMRVLVRTPSARRF